MPNNWLVNWICVKVRQEREQQQQHRMGAAGGNFGPPNNKYEAGIQGGPGGPLMLGMPEQPQQSQGVNELDPKCSRTLFIGNVPREIEETDLYKIFRKYGKILVSHFKLPVFLLLSVNSLVSVI